MGELRFWAGTLMHGSLTERLEAAAAGGYTTLSLFPGDHRRAREAGVGDAEILAAHERAGVRLTTLDPYAQWLPRFEPPDDMPPGRAERVFADEEAFFATVEALGLETLTAIEPFGTAYERDELIESFGVLCDRAARSGARVHLEFTPFSGIPDLATAWDVVQAVNRDNGGLVFDTWHYFRGTRDDDLLDSIPGEKIFAVQIDDAAAEPVGSLMNDTLHHRLLPGEGTFDLTTVLGILGRKPAIGPPGIEVLSDALWKLPPDELGRRSRTALDTALRAAGWVDGGGGV